MEYRESSKLSAVFLYQADAVTVDSEGGLAPRIELIGALLLSLTMYSIHVTNDCAGLMEAMETTVVGCGR